MQDTNDNHWLLPYLEGTLDVQQTAVVEARLAADPEFAAEAERLGRTLDSLHTAASRTPLPVNATPPADLWPRLRARIVLEPALRRAMPTRLWWAAGTGLAAASLVLAGILWHPAHQDAELPPKLPSTALRQTARETPTPVEAARPQNGRPVVLPPQKQIAIVPKPSVPITQADPFALPPPQVSPPQVARHVLPPVMDTAKKPPVQIASRNLNFGQNPELTPPVPMTMSPPAPPAVPLPATQTPRVPPVAMAAPPSLPSNSVAGAIAVTPKTEQKIALKAQALPKTATSDSAVIASDQEQKAKSQPNNLYQHPGLAFGQTSAGKTEPTPQTLDDWQASLAGAMHPPLWGGNAGMQQANQALMNAQMAGQLNELQDRLETQREQSASDVVTSRMLAAVDEFGGFASAALEERRRTVTLDGSDGEDWFALAQAEERAGHSTAARAAYQRALVSPVPPPPFHAAIARQRSQ